MSQKIERVSLPLPIFSDKAFDNGRYRFDFTGDFKSKYQLNRPALERYASLLGRPTITAPMTLTDKALYIPAAFVVLQQTNSYFYSLAEEASSLYFLGRDPETYDLSLKLAFADIARYHTRTDTVLHPSFLTRARGSLAYYYVATSELAERPWISPKF